MPKLLAFLFIPVLCISQNYIYEPGDWWILSHPGAITAITEADLEIYFVADNGIYVYDKQNMTLEYDYYFTDQLKEGRINHFYYDKYSDIFWMVSDKGLYLKSYGESFWRRSTYNPVNWEVNAIGSSPDYVWLNLGNQMKALDAYTGARVTPEEETDISAISWGASRYGPAGRHLHFYDYLLPDDDMQLHQNSEPVYTSPAIPTVEFEDREGVVFFGMDNGEIYYAPYGAHQLAILSVGIAQPNITDIYKDEASNWWFSDSPFKRIEDFIPTNSVFLTRWLEADDSWTYYYADEDVDIQDTNINCTLRVRDDLYLGTMQGLLILDINDREWKSVQDGLNDPAIWDLAVHGNELYAATALGINEISTRYPTVIPDTDHLFSRFNNTQIFDLLTWGDQLYVGAESGLFRLTFKTREWEKLSSRHMRSVTVNDSLIFASDGFLWQVIPGQEDSIVYSDEIFSFANYGPYIWINEEDQAVLMKLDTDFKRVYNKFDGITGSQIYDIGCDDQWVWFGTNGGVAFFNWGNYYQTDQ